MTAFNPASPTRWTRNRTAPTRAAYDKIQRRWQRLQQRGFLLHILLFGTLMTLWMAVCEVTFSYLFGTLPKLLRNPDPTLLHVYVWSMVPLLVGAGFTLPAFQYWFTRRMASYPPPADTQSLA